MLSGDSRELIKRKAHDAITNPAQAGTLQHLALCCRGFTQRAKHIDKACWPAQRAAKRCSGVGDRRLYGLVPVRGRQLLDYLSVNAQVAAEGFTLAEVGAHSSSFGVTNAAEVATARKKA
jgi:hypothetical protein